MIINKRGVGNGLKWPWRKSDLWGQKVWQSDIFDSRQTNHWTNIRWQISVSYYFVLQLCGSTVRNWCSTQFWLIWYTFRVVVQWTYFCTRRGRRFRGPTETELFSLTPPVKFEKSESAGSSHPHASCRCACTVIACLLWIDSFLQTHHPPTPTTTTGTWVWRGWRRTI